MGAPRAIRVALQETGQL